MRPITSVRARRVRNRKRRSQRTLGFVLYESDSIVVIVTLRSKNRKTGSMLQVWILARNVSPIDAVKQGQDSLVCFDCRHRGEGFQKRTCYVNLRSPQAIWRAYQRGRYAFLTAERYAEVFTNRKVRFGAYGEPVLIPLGILQAITSASNGWTGYTHQWKRAEYQVYRAYVMASCDSAMEYAEAHSAGWRTFRVRSEFEPLITGEIACPASDEMNHRTTCDRCGLCNGAKPADARKSIAIIVHGSGSKNFVSIDSIARAA